MDTKYIFVTGGVVSSLGKGITAAGIGQLLKSRGLNVTIQKFDPYINLDPGKMSPYQHGEVFVTEDGAETDLDLGHYERFIDVNLNKNCSVSNGRIYWSVLNKERIGAYDGRTVQVIPHVTNEIKERIRRVSKDKDVDVVITEIGGTVGDIESLPMLEAIRQIKYDIGKENVMYIHVTLVPYLSKAGELKTKPTQHSVKELRSLGIQPDVLICRTEVALAEELRDKIALFCDLQPNEVIENLDASTIYEIPLMLEKEGLAELVIDKLDLKCDELDLSEWENLVKKVKNPTGTVKVGLVGKYVELKDAYLSVAEALRHGAIWNDIDVEIEWIHSEEVTSDNVGQLMEGISGIIVPGGFGDRGIDGKIVSINYARENKIPFLGIGLGMQMAVVEFARNVCKLDTAHSREFDVDTKYPVIDMLPENEGLDILEIPMRLGTYPCRVIENTKAYDVYKDEIIYERHRNKYEFNKEYKETLEANGLIISGISPDEKFIEIIELEDHPFFIGVQYHAEFKSRPTKAHPLFQEFIKKSYEYGK